MWNDLRYAARLLAKDHTFTVAAVLALVIGMSATTTMFTIVHGNCCGGRGGDGRRG
jgi:hypothetical protein